MYEAVMGEKRPEGLTAEQCIDAMPDEDQRDDFLRAARAAVLYLLGARPDRRYDGHLLAS